jgi:putative hemolysin
MKRVKRLSGPRTHVCWTPDNTRNNPLVSLVLESELVELEKSSNVLDFSCEELPEDWELTFGCTRGELSLVLKGPDGEIVSDDAFCDDDCGFEDMVKARVNYARRADGLGAIE